MFTFENTVVIDRPIGEVFAFGADLPSIPKWNYYALRVSSTTPQPGTVGTTYHQIRKNDEQDLRIAQLEPNRLLVVETKEVSQMIYALGGAPAPPNIAGADAPAGAMA